MSKILVLLSLALVLIWAQTSVDNQGAQVIDSKQSYMFNLRYASVSKKIYYRADKSINNVFSATTAGPEASKFILNPKSPFNTTSSFFAFDVISNKGADFIVGSTFQPHSDGLSLVVASTDGSTSQPLLNQAYNFYSPLIDHGSLLTDTVNVYFAGWGYETTGLIVARTSATLLPHAPLITLTTNNVKLLQTECYDVWTDINKPHLYIDTIDGKKYLMVVVPGRCDGIYKIELNDKEEFSKAFADHFNETATINSDIFSNTYDPKKQVMFYAYKEYNSDNIYLASVNMKTMSPNPGHRKLGHNDTNPILAFDTAHDNIFFASSDYNHIYKIPSSDINKQTIATLPVKLKSVSSALVVDDFLYIVTYEADAQLARFQISKHFCEHFCGTWGYCGDSSGVCLCASGYAVNTTAKNDDPHRCVPKHEIEIQEFIIAERGVAITMGILFFIALAGAIVGWFMWWRGRKLLYSSMS